MKSRDFCYWLQGYFEIAGENVVQPAMALSPDQVSMIKRHLAMVFKHEIDPSHGNQSQQDALNEIHSWPDGGVIPSGPIFRC
jgi:hypothetical protein